MKNFLIILVILALLAIGSYYFFFKDSVTTVDNSSSVINSGEEQEQPTEQEYKTETKIGTSVEGREILAYHYGTGDTELVFIGGTHGGYSWNTTLVAYELMDYLAEDESAVPNNIRVTVVPTLNPDGLFTVTGKEGRFTKADVGDDTVPGRFNANEVDLNRNFDCDWQEEAKWQGRDVSGGVKPFSEPESQAIRL